MQKELVIIRPIYPKDVNVKGPRRLVCQTKINDSYFVLTDRWRMMTLNDFTQLTDKTERIMEIQFSQTNKEFRIEFYLKDRQRVQPETADKSWPIERTGEWQRAKNLEDQEIAKNAWIRTAVFHFFGRHEQIKQLQSFGNGHVPSSEEFEIDFITQKGRIFNLIDRKRIKAASIVNEMNVPELINTVMFYAPYLHGRRPSEMRNGLVGLRGVAMGNTDGTGAAVAEPCGVLMNEPNLTDFLENFKPNGVNSIKIYVNKGIEYGIITKSNTGHYIHNGAVHCGNSVDDVIQYFVRNQDEYLNFLQPEVGKEERIPEDDCKEWSIADVASVLSSTEAKKKRYEDTLTTNKSARVLREEEASRLGIKYANRKSDEQLDQEIAAAQLKLTKEQHTAGAPTAQASKLAGAAS